MVKPINSDNSNIFHIDTHHRVTKVKRGDEPKDLFSDEMLMIKGAIDKLSNYINTPSHAKAEQVIDLLQDAKKILHDYSISPQPQLIVDAKKDLNRAKLTLDRGELYFRPPGAAEAADDLVANAINGLEKKFPSPPNQQPESPRSIRSGLRHFKNALKKGKIDLL